MKYSEHDPQVFYYDKLEKYKNENTDKNELDFINQNLDFYDDFVEEIKTDESLSKDDFNGYLNYRNYFRDKKEIYLLKNSKDFISIKKESNNTGILWKGTQLQFAELVKALRESNMISPELTQKQLFEKLCFMFNVQPFNQSDKLKDIRNRTNTQTPFINILEISLIKWIERKD